MTTYLNTIDDGEVLSYVDLLRQRDELLAACQLARAYMLARPRTAESREVLRAILIATGVTERNPA